MTFVIIYGFHDPPQASTSPSSVAQTVDGNLRVRAPGFQSSASPFLGATLRAHSSSTTAVATSGFTFGAW